MGRLIILAVLALGLLGASISRESAQAEGPPTYCASTNGTVNTGTTAGTVTSIIYVFHPASSQKKFRVRYGEIHGSQGSGTGRYLLRVTGITAENETPGGTLQPALPFVAFNPASTAIVRSGAAAPTRVTGDYFVDSMFATAEADIRLEAIQGFQTITLLPGVASGVELRSEVTVNMSGGAEIAAWICWSEE